jgi:hypothetical protein
MGAWLLQSLLIAYTSSLRDTKAFLTPTRTRSKPPQKGARV